MNIPQAIILGIVQGATEFIPVSSSAHLVLVPWALRWTQPDITFDLVLHIGTLAAVIAYFWADLWQLLFAWVRSIPHLIKQRGVENTQAKLAWWLILATIPAGALGYFFNDTVESLFASPRFVGFLLLVTAVILTATERWGHRKRTLDSLNWRDAVAIGLAQAVALAPGISRSGATISAGLACGFRRPDAARFSFLLSIPIIAGAGLSQAMNILDVSSVSISPFPLVSGFIAAAITGYLCIRFLLRYLQAGRLYIFAAYCAIIGSAVIAFSTLA